jgi:hypothetical protein
MKHPALKMIVALAALRLMGGCAVIEDLIPPREDPAVQNEMAFKALAALESLREVDAFIRLDSALLARAIQVELEAQAALVEEFELRDLQVRFNPQHISLQASVRSRNAPAEAVRAEVTGDVLLAFSGNRLIWMPRFNQLVFREPGFAFLPGEVVEQSPESRGILLARINREITEAVIVLGKNTVHIDPVPLGHIETGARVSGFLEATAAGSRELKGVFTVAGSAILVEPEVTSIALDLEFTPSVSECPANLRVSRAAFASDIRNDEPFDVSRLIESSGEIRHFFTEIAGAWRPTTIVHYWYADGRAVAVEELRVGPGQRWRTWSTRTIDRSAGNWEVIVVEKASGCILHSQALRMEPEVEVPEPADRAAAGTTFERLKSAFTRRVDAFSILQDQPDVALVEVRREFLVGAMQTALKDLQVNLHFNLGPVQGQRLTTSIMPMDVTPVSCEQRECVARRECPRTFTQCVRQRDTRDCKTCLFRNPLNGRCVREGEDPICEAGKTVQNNRFEEEWEACLYRETAARADCERLREQEFRSCQLEVGAELSACMASRDMAVSQFGGGPFGSLSGQARPSGGLRAVLSGFAIEGDLEGLRASMSFISSLDLDGRLTVRSRETLGALARCMDAWQGSYRSKMALPLTAKRLNGSMQAEQGDLVSSWPVYKLSATVTPTPLEAVFVHDPGLLADCHIGLTSDKVLDALSGRDAAYYSGRIDLEVHPQPARIVLAPAVVAFNLGSYRARPTLSGHFLTFEITRSSEVESEALPVRD